MRELSVAEQRYQAVLAVISEGRTVTEVAGRWGVSRQSVHAWLARYEAGGVSVRRHTHHQADLRSELLRTLTNSARSSLIRGFKPQQPSGRADRRVTSCSVVYEDGTT